MRSLRGIWQNAYWAVFLGVVATVNVSGAEHGVPATDPYAARKVFYEQLWQTKIEAALKYVDGAVVSVNVELTPQISRSIVTKEYDPHPVAEISSEQSGARKEQRSDSTGQQPRSSTSETSYVKNLVSETEVATTMAGLVPESVSVTISVPKSYYSAVLASRRQTDSLESADAMMRSSELRAIEQNVCTRIEDCVAALLPRNHAGLKMVRVVSFDNLTTAPDRKISMGRKVSDKQPEVVTVIFSAKDAGESSLQGLSPRSRVEGGTPIRLAAFVTETRPNGNLVIEANRTLKSDGQLISTQVTGIIRPESIRPRDNTVQADQIADLRIMRRVLQTDSVILPEPRRPGTEQDTAAARLGIK